MSDEAKPWYDGWQDGFMDEELSEFDIDEFVDASEDDLEFEMGDF